jgi:hypothetical protein
LRRSSLGTAIVSDYFTEGDRAFLMQFVEGSYFG